MRIKTYKELMNSDMVRMSAKRYVWFLHLERKGVVKIHHATYLDTMIKTIMTEFIPNRNKKYIHADDRTDLELVTGEFQYAVLLHGEDSYRHLKDDVLLNVLFESDIPDDILNGGLEDVQIPDREIALAIQSNIDNTIEEEYY